MKGVFQRIDYYKHRYSRQTYFVQASFDRITALYSNIVFLI